MSAWVKRLNRQGVEFTRAATTAMWSRPGKAGSVPIPLKNHLFMVTRRHSLTSVRPFYWPLFHLIALCDGYGMKANN